MSAVPCRILKFKLPVVACPPTDPPDLEHEGQPPLPPDPAPDEGEGT